MFSRNMYNKTEEQISSDLQKHSINKYALQMIDMEYLAAQEAIESGMYVTFRNEEKKSDCFRIGSQSMCFCGHLFAEHPLKIVKARALTPCANCICKSFKLTPRLPEETGMHWLSRRKNFVEGAWKASCKCKHNHIEHACNHPQMCKKCNCVGFNPDYGCVGCDRKWEDHDILYESEQERRILKKSIGKEFLPYAQNLEIQQMVMKNLKTKTPHQKNQ